MVEMSVMVFAAGFGKRMGALTKDRPKPLLKVCGLPLIDHALALTDGIDKRSVVVNTHYKHEMLKAHLFKAPIKINSEFPDILETGGGLKAALPMLQTNPVVTLNSDAVWAGKTLCKNLSVIGIVHEWMRFFCAFLPREDMGIKVQVIS